jgi:lysophospholipase L1-like esterase
MNLILQQTIYILSAIILSPFFPFLYLQGQYVRRKIGLLPDAQGERHGKFGAEKETVKLLVIGESTVAGLGARTHETALAGQFAKFLSQKIGKSVEWYVIGKNGVTAERTIIELVPNIPDEKFDYILAGVGGNDVLKLSSPFKWRHDMTKLLGILKAKNPAVTIFMTNAPAVHLSPVLPQPIKFLLGELSRMHDKNSQKFTAAMEKVYYFHRPTEITKGFFADGLHPSEQGYADWSQRMIEFFSNKYNFD